MKEIIIGIIGLTLLVWAMYQKPDVVNPMDMEHSHDHTGIDAHSTHQPTPSNKTINNQNKSTSKNSGSLSEKQLTGNPHFDQLSPKMQQSLKDSLLLEGPRETYTLDNGTVILPAKDRFTQMPVAVRMPDGTIQIKEYSYIPKPKVQIGK